MNFNNSHEAWGKTTYLEWVKSCGEIFYTGVCDTNWNPRDFFKLQNMSTSHVWCTTYQITPYNKIKSRLIQITLLRIQVQKVRIR